MDEREFLKNYNVEKYFRPSVTADALLFTPQGSVLMIKRKNHPFMGCWGFPGGFLEKDETLMECALRELYEETGITGVPLKQSVTVGTPHRDPRTRTITVCFIGVTPKLAATGGDDAAIAEWLDFRAERRGNRAELHLSVEGADYTASLEIVETNGEFDFDNTRIVERGCLAFDHAKILYYAAERLGFVKNLG